MIIKTLKKIDELLPIMEIEMTPSGYTLSINKTKNVTLTEEEFKKLIADLTNINTLESYIDYIIEHFITGKKEMTFFKTMLLKELTERNIKANEKIKNIEKEIEKYNEKIKTLEMQISKIEKNNKKYKDCYLKYFGE